MRMRLGTWTVAAVLSASALLPACSGAEKKKDGKGAADAGAPKTPSGTLADLVENAWTFHLRENPEEATLLGIHDWDDRLTELGEEARNRRAAQARAYREAALAIDGSALSPEERVTRDIVVREMSDVVAAHDLQEHLWAALDQNDGPQSGGFALLLRRHHPRRTVKDVENLVARCRAFGPWMDAYIADLQEGLAKEMAAPSVVAERVTAQLAELAAGGVEKSGFLQGPMPDGLSEEDKTRLQNDLRAAVTDVVMPAFAKLQSYLESEYVLSARTKPGIGSVPNGPAIYAWLVEHHATRKLSPDDVHALGLKELASIEGEMMQVALSLKHKKGRPLSEFNDKLKKDKKNYARDKDELLGVYRAALDRARAKATDAFEKLPTVDVEVVEIEAARAASAPAGAYQDADLDGTRKAQFEANVLKPDAHPLHNAEALTFHETIPGHHLQGGLARELDALPKLRRAAWFGAYGEGWALYAEKLADELGLYSSPQARYGYLSSRAFRAARLVVDTGLHAKGWDRAKAVDFMKAHTTLSAHEIDVEVDRYIAWPGQALGYMLGALEIEALRRESEAKLGANFDRKRFHAVVLGSGPVPLDVLRANVEAYAAVAAPAAAAPSTEAVDGGAGQ